MSNKVIFFSKIWYPAWIIDEVEELTKNPNIGSIDHQRLFRAARAALYFSGGIWEARQLRRF